MIVAIHSGVLAYQSSVITEWKSAGSVAVPYSLPPRAELNKSRKNTDIRNQRPLEP